MKLIYTYCLLLLSMISNAQNWATDGTVWRYNFINLSGLGYIQIAVDGDTTVDGVDCKKLTKRIFQRNSFTGTTQNFVIGNEFTYEANGVVFLRHQGAFDTLYNFNANVGDSWSVPGVSPVQSVCNATSMVEVVSVENVNINGVDLKQLIVDYKYRTTGTFVIRDTIIERIGTLGQYLVPWDLCLSTVDGNEGGELRCFNDNEIGEYKHNFFSNCNVLVSAEEKLLATLEVFPNPFSEVLLFRNNNEVRISSIILNDFLGRTIFEAEYLPEYLDTQNFPSGMYFLNIIDESGNSSVRKILKY